MSDSTGTRARPSSPTPAGVPPTPEPRSPSEPTTAVGTTPTTPTTPATTLGVVLASAGRPELLADALRGLAAQCGVDGQDAVPAPVVVSVPDEASLPADRSLLGGCEVVVGTRGLAAQRNAGLDALARRGGVDAVAFFDDDAVVRPDYLARARRFLDDRPEILGLTGRVLLDGKTSGEISAERSRAALDATAGERATGSWSRTRELYGANFVVRVARVPDLRFDERLPLYSWLEDHDVARRLGARGPLARVEDCVIVHRAAASGGRQSHVRLGYSQVMNAVHLHRRGSFPLWLAVQQILRPVAKNLVLSPTGGQRSWRRSRLRGNALAAADAARGRITPERITEL